MHTFMSQCTSLRPIQRESISGIIPATSSLLYVTSMVIQSVLSFPLPPS